MKDAREIPVPKGSTLKKSVEGCMKACARDPKCGGVTGTQVSCFTGTSDAFRDAPRSSQPGWYHASKQEQRTDQKGPSREKLVFDEYDTRPAKGRDLDEMLVSCTEACHADDQCRVLSVSAEAKTCSMGDAAALKAMVRKPAPDGDYAGYVRVDAPASAAESLGVPGTTAAKVKAERDTIGDPEEVFGKRYVFEPIATKRFDGTYTQESLLVRCKEICAADERCRIVAAYKPEGRGKNLCRLGDVDGMETRTIKEAPRWSGAVLAGKDAAPTMIGAETFVPYTGSIEIPAGDLGTDDYEGVVSELMPPEFVVAKKGLTTVQSMTLMAFFAVGALVLVWMGVVFFNASLSGLVMDASAFLKASQASAKAAFSKGAQYTRPK